MEVIKNHNLKLKQSVVTIGAFDGIHIGHQSLIKKTVNRARQLNVPAVVYTFDPPPRPYFQNQMILTTVEEKVGFLKKLGIDYAIIARFDEDYVARSAEDFLKELEALSPQEVWIGPNFQFGKGKQGTTKELAARFHTFIHPLVKCANGQPVSSTRIRNLLDEQEEKLANELLGRDLFAGA
ncbi:MULTISPECIES: FAD synthetase [Bacillaceae]|uniref:FAD synthetase n=1 Tax=Bacillaceae TaxID=186817 RepID=UPI000E71A7EF|nr:FAD synthetase [Bacillus sp. PK3_68]RJS61921.1 FAD synthetase [Bacillus sp. PK3_68]